MPQRHCCDASTTFEKWWIRYYSLFLVKHLCKRQVCSYVDWRKNRGGEDMTGGALFAMVILLRNAVPCERVMANLEHIVFPYDAQV
jgi:hypothetical protein